MIAALENEFPGAVYSFPYDWRQSNRASAQRLKEWLTPILIDARRLDSRCQVSFVCHSMGGLVARYFAHCLDSLGVTQRIICIGTPFLGSVKALNSWFPRRVGRIGPDLSQLVRSFPSAAELLPVYPCVNLGIRKTLVPLTDAGFEEVYEAAHHGADFHLEMRQAVSRRSSASGPVYHVILGNSQRTPVVFSMSEADSLPPADSPYSQSGDGTVARISAFPPEWEDDAACFFASGRHASLQSTKNIVRQVLGILSARPRPPMATPLGIAVESDEDAIAVGDKLTVRGTFASRELSTPMTLSLYDDAGELYSGPSPFRKVSATEWIATTVLRRRGLFRWDAASALDANEKLQPISDVVIVL
ncbi:hypothetical protein B0293_04650 [Amycolatopsis azurea DSM 43854]|uniref:Lecithin:cholesterol acyltransferase n=1 Tax=Amycolatopsis azurea DSM 43854 TaxID=1238180 RepID=A0ABX3JK76_9PSEU|nr:hypothetical protein B0293_04650 [Amycolatopsis azurea DSM 43854]